MPKNVKIEDNYLKQQSHKVLKSISQNKKILNQNFKRQNYRKTLNISDIQAIILFVLFQLIPLVSSQSCLEFKGNICVKCPQNMNLYKQECYFNIPLCRKYINGIECAQCQDNYSLREDRSSCIKQERLRQNYQDKNLITQQSKNYQLVFSQFPEPQYTLIQLLKKHLSYQKLNPQPLQFASQTAMPLPETFNNQISYIQIQKQNYVRYFSEELRQKTLLQLPPTQLLKLVRLYKGRQANLSQIGNPYRAVFEINNGYIDVLCRIKQARKSQRQKKSQKKLSDLKEQNLQLRQPEITIYMIKKLLFNSKNLKSITEPYKDIQISDIKKYITDKYSNLWPKISDTEILASYKGQDNTTKKYVVYLLQKNFGLLQIQMQVDSQSYKPASKLYKKQQIPAYLIKITKTMQESNYFKPYLKDAQIYSIAEVLYDNNFITYNVTYNHNSINGQQNNKKSYYMFNLNPKQPIIYVRSMYLLLRGFENYEMKNYKSMISRFGDLDSIFSHDQDTYQYTQSYPIYNQQKLFLYSVQPITVQISQNLSPNNKQITVSINYIQILNTRQFQISSVYNAILQYMMRINAKKQVSNLQKLIVLENSANTVYELMYMPQEDQQNIYFQFYKFILDKVPLNNGSRLMEFVEYYRIPYNERLIIKLEERNREQTINNLTQTQKFILNLIKNQSLYGKDSLLVQVTTRNYTTSTQQTLIAKIHTFKYYFPPQLNKTYQFIQFRYVQFYRSFDKYFKSYGHIITPKQNFVPIDAKTRDRILLFLNFYSIFNVKNQESINYFQLMDSYSSIDRPKYYRIGVLINNKNLYLCEVYEKFLKEFLILQIIQKFQTQIDKNIPEKYSNYPIQNFQDKWKTIKQGQAQSEASLSADEIKNIIMLIFYQNNLTNFSEVEVNVKKQDEMLGLYDRFQIQFVEKNKLSNNNRYKLVFDAPKNYSRIKYPSEVISNTSSNNQSINMSQSGSNNSQILNMSINNSNVSKTNQNKTNISSNSSQANLSNQINQTNKKIEIIPTTNAGDQKAVNLINQSIIEGKIVRPELRNNDTKTALPLGLSPPNATNFTTFTVREPLGSLPRLQGTVISLVNSQNQNSKNNSGFTQNLTSVPLVAADTSSSLSPSISPTPTSISNQLTNNYILQDKLHNFMQSSFNIRPISFYSQIQHSFLDMVIFKQPTSASIDTKTTIQNMFLKSNNSSDIQIIVQSQRLSIIPSIKMIDMQIKYKQNLSPQNVSKPNLIPYKEQRTQKLRVWLSQMNKLIKIQTKEDGTVKQFKQIHSKILQDNSYLIQIQRICRKQIINTMSVIGSSNISIFGYEAGTDFLKNMQIDYNNIIYLKQKRISDILQVQIYYQLNQILIKIIISSKINQNTIEYNILSTNIYANGLKQLKQLNQENRIKVMSQLKKSIQFGAVLEKIIKQYGKFQDQDVVDISVRVVNKYLFYQILHIVKNKYYFISAIYDTTKKKLSGINFSPYTQNPQQKLTENVSREQKIQKLKQQAVEKSIKLIKGCKLKILGSLECLQCQSEYYLGKDYQCYPLIRGCQVQSGILCVLCASGYIDTVNFSCQ